MCCASEDRRNAERGRRLYNDQLNLCEHHGLSELNEIRMQKRARGTKSLCEE